MIRLRDLPPKEQDKAIRWVYGFTKILIFGLAVSILISVIADIWDRYHH